MSVDRILSQMREVRGLTQQELAGMLDVSVTTVSCWERGVKSPSLENLKRISDALRCPVNDLISEDNRIDFEFKTLEDKYRRLDRFGRDVVNAVCDAELARVRAAYTLPRDGKPVQAWYLPLYNTPSAAGVTAPIEGSDFEMVLAPESTPDDTDYLVRISGDSMAPKIPNRAIVCIKECKTLRPGDIGIFCVNGSMYCKKYSPTPEGDLLLMSVNRKCAYADVLVTRDSMDSVVCCGKVVGVVNVM